MTVIEGIDYAWARPSPKVLHDIGKRFAVRYLSYNTTGKNLTRTEAEALCDAGLSVVLVWETTANAAMGGFEAGRRHATDALSQAHAVGAPWQPVIYFAVDFDAVGNELRIVGEYFRGVSQVIPLHRIGVYGGYRTVDYLWRNGFATFLWQTYAWSSYWLASDGTWTVVKPNDPNAKQMIRWHPQCHAHQYRNGVTIDGADCDLDRAVKDQYGQWTIGGDVSVWEEDLKLYTGYSIKAGYAMRMLLFRTDYIGNTMDLPGKLKEILDAIADINSPATASPEVVAALTALHDDITRVPDTVADELASRVAS